MRLPALAILFAVAVAPGCKSTPPSGGQDRVPPAASGGGGAGNWPFKPIGMRVHPFTTFVVDKSGKESLDARLELVDEMGDVTKGLGKLRFELYAGAATEGRAGQGERLYIWEASVATVEETREHYDPITRTYYFKLRLDKPPPRRQKLRLDVQFDGAWGQRMTATAEIEGTGGKD